MNTLRQAPACPRSKDTSPAEVSTDRDTGEAVSLDWPIIVNSPGKAASGGLQRVIRRVTRRGYTSRDFLMPRMF
jgi:hypothetical protein